jgi:hypothetical protein
MCRSWTGRLEDDARLVAVTPCLKGAIDLDQFWPPGIVTLKALEVLDLLAAIPDIPILGRGIPVVGVLDEVAVFEDLVADHDTRHPCDQLRLVQDPHRVGLGSTAVFPLVADPQREVGVRVRRVPGVAKESRVEVRIVAVLPEGLAGVETPVTLLPTKLLALLTRRLGLD